MSGGFVPTINVHGAGGLHATAETAPGTDTHWLTIGFGGQFSVSVFTKTLEEAQAYADAINAVRLSREPKAENAEAA